MARSAGQSPRTRVTSPRMGGWPQQMPTDAAPQARIRRVFELVEPIATVTLSEVPNEAFLALGMRNYWDGYFAGQAAPLGLGWCTRSSATSPMARWHATSRGFGNLG